MSYKLLLNETYMYLLENGPAAINYSQLAREIGVNRIKISQQLEELILTGWVVEDNKVFSAENELCITNFHSELNNKYEKAIQIYKDLNPNVNLSCESLAKIFGISSKTLSKFYAPNSKIVKEKVQAAVYYIKDLNTDQIIYIGYTTNFEDRKNAHLRLIRTNSTTAQLYRICSTKNIKNVEIDIIISSNDLNMLKKLEQSLISLLKPIGNENLS